MDKAEHVWWGIDGDQRLLVESARVLRCGITAGVDLTQPHGEYVMLGLSRLLDAIAFSMRTGDGVDPAVISGAMEIARHVTTYLQPMVRGRCPRP
jgi:hypothetical protein